MSNKIYSGSARVFVSYRSHISDFQQPRHHYWNYCNCWKNCRRICLKSLTLQGYLKNERKRWMKPNVLRARVYIYVFLQYYSTSVSIEPSSLTNVVFSRPNYNKVWFILPLESTMSPLRIASTLLLSTVNCTLKDLHQYNQFVAHFPISLNDTVAILLFSVIDQRRIGSEISIRRTKSQEASSSTAIKRQFTSQWRIAKWWKANNQ